MEWKNIGDRHGLRDTTRILYHIAGVKHKCELDEDLVTRCGTNDMVTKFQNVYLCPLMQGRILDLQCKKIDR